MTYREEEQVKLRRQSTKQAVALAMEGRWREAVAANTSIIDSFPNDVTAYNRLGRAHMELGEYSQAREAYRQAIELDPYNVIAKKNLDRLANLEEPVAGPEADARTAEPDIFIEEVGKTGVVNLHHPAPPKILAKMVAGDRVYLKIDGASLTVENGHGDYLGEVDSRHAQRLIKLMEGGNRYTAAIIRSSKDAVAVIIKEVYQSPSQAGQLSFPAKEFEEPRTSVGDRIIKRELELKEAAVEEPGYTIIDIDEEGIEIALKESLESEEEKTEEEE